MPKKIDPKVKERCVRQVLEHLPEYSSVTAAAEVVARREGLGKETVRRWVVQAQIDGGQRQGATSQELAEIKDLKAKVRRLEEDNEILRRASIFFAGSSTPQSLIVAFIDELRAEGHAVESICRVLREQGCRVAARTYREWAQANQAIALRTISDAVVVNQVRDLVWKVDPEGVRRMTPEGLYGRRKMTALVRRATPRASPAAWTGR